MTSTLLPIINLSTGASSVGTAFSTIVSGWANASYNDQFKLTGTSQALPTSIAASSTSTSLACYSTGSASMRPGDAYSKIEEFCGQQDHLVSINPTASTSQSFPELQQNNTISVSWVPGCKSNSPAYSLNLNDCATYLNDSINECGRNSNDVYGGSLTANCIVYAVTPQPYIIPAPSLNAESVVCGAFNDGRGMGHPTFSTANAYDAIDKYCNGAYNYTSDMTTVKNKNGEKIIGYALDRFWYRGSADCTTTDPHGRLPGSKTVCDGSNDYEINVGVMFNSSQTGCQRTQTYFVPKGKECSDTLGKVILSCKYPIHGTSHVSVVLTTLRQFSAANSRRQGRGLF